MKKNSVKILRSTYHPQSKKDILEKIDLFLMTFTPWIHITSLNPENIMHAYHNVQFNNILSQKSIQIVDGFGVLLACDILGYLKYERITGATFMNELIHTYGRKGYRFLFIGGKANVAKELVECYSKIYPKSQFFGTHGIMNIHNPKLVENRELTSIITEVKPNFVFVAFGSPAQEIWIDSQKALLEKSVCMGVGGGFDFALGKVIRAPIWIQKIGLEWLFRLVIEPWRLKRQLSILHFLFLVVKQRISLKHSYIKSV